MTSFLAQRRSASNWKVYYDLYVEAYREIARRCLMGDVTFGQHVHHTAVPDAQGDSGGFLNWVAYSQPSARTLAVYLPTLADVLTKETHRSNSRYILLASDNEPISADQAHAAMSEVPFPVDYWLGAMPAILEQAPKLGSLLGAELLFGKPGSAAHLVLTKEPSELAQKLRGSYSSNSRVPARLRNSFSDSFFVLWAYEHALPIKTLSSVLGAGTWLACALAQARLAKATDEISVYLREASASSQGGENVHVVKPGDTLGRIVRSTYGMSFDTMWPLIRSLNPSVANPDVIYPNQKLILPKLED